MNRNFVIGLSPDFRFSGLQRVEEIVRQTVEESPGVRYIWLAEMGDEIQAEIVDEVDAVLSLGIRYTADSFVDLQRLALISRWGVGYDMIDVDACTAAGVALAIAPNAIRRPVAEGSLTLVLALLKRLPYKDRVVRQGLWRNDVGDYGHTTTGVTVGTIGLGSIGSEFMRLASIFSFPRLLAYDPYAPAERARDLGVEMVSLDTLLQESDVVTIHCLLNEETRHLIGKRELELMKPGAYLVNTARGPIVDQKALVEVLRGERIAGAALDVLEKEPPDANDPILQLDNVILAPHAIAWTAELIEEMTLESLQACLDFAQGRLPQNLVNQSVLDHPSFRVKFDRARGMA